MAATIVTACSGSESGQSLDDIGELDQPARASQQDLRVAVGPDPFAAGNPVTIGLSTTGPNPGIFDTLTRLTTSFSVVPALATSWENPSPREWRFTLREGVSFHDGRPFDAQAVAANLDRIATRQNRPRGLDPGAARATSARTVQVTLTQDNTRLAEQLASPAMGMIAPGTQPGPGDTPATTPTGTGPFRFESYRPNEELKVVAHDGYWDQAPVLRSIAFRFGPEADAGRLLATRQVQAVGHVAHDSLPTLSGRTDRLVSSSPAQAVYLLLNTGGVDRYATLKDDNVRRAVALAIDRAAVAQVWKEYGEANRSVVPEVVLGEDTADRVTPVARNLEQSRQLLSRAGWAPGPDGVRVRSGQPLVLTLVLARPAQQQAAVEPLRRALSEAGIGLEVADLGGESPFLRLVGATFDLFLETRVQEDGNPCALCRFFTLEQGGSVNFSASVGGGPAADELFARAYAAPSSDTAKRLAADLMNVVVSERVTAVPLASLRAEWLLSPRIKAFEPAALPGDQRWDKVWLSL